MRFFIFLIIYAIPFIAILWTAKSLYILKTSRSENLENKDSSAKTYSSIRTRGSVRHGMNKIKNPDVYYKMEKDITFPKR